jgi:hypothetical protein
MQDSAAAYASTYLNLNLAVHSSRYIAAARTAQKTVSQLLRFFSVYRTITEQRSRHGLHRNRSL